MTELERVSFTTEEWNRIKRRVSGGRPYAHRMSIGLTTRLLQVESGKDLRPVLRELDYLEGFRESSSTKEEKPFKHGRLRSFWHKHYFAPRHLMRNLGERWGIRNDGNHDLLKMLHHVAKLHGDDPDRWPAEVEYRLFVDGFNDRAARGLTGNWIIYAKHEGLNYYLDLAVHEEGRDQDCLYRKLRAGSVVDFPFVFPDQEERS